jgi:CBS domain containing-hemolysin-like protein
MFLLVCATVYIGTVAAAFAALMRLSLRLDAERHDWLDRLGYLENPIRLFVPLRFLEGVAIAVVATFSMLVTDARGATAVVIVVAIVLVYVIVFGHLIPLTIVRRDPVRVLELLLPPLQAVIRVLQPLALPLFRIVSAGRVLSQGSTAGDVLPQADGNANYFDSQGEAEQGRDRSDQEAEEHALLQSVVEFGDTLVREVMTPRPDIVAVSSDATLDELRKLFTEQQYSRLPVFENNLDTVTGFVFVKDLVALGNRLGSDQVVEELLRPAYVVPETKRVAELLKELQHKHVQSAVVHDEYGGTAGLVTIEDLLEEIVGEIRDEYDVETDPIVEETNGAFVFSGGVSIDDMTKRLGITIETQGFETVAGYVLARLGRVPQVGENFNIDDVNVSVLEAERRRVHRVRFRRRLSGESE